MKKIFIVLLLACSVAGAGTWSHAEEAKQPDPKAMTGKGMMKGKMGMMKGGMMGMMHKSMVASADGGVIILSGQKLLKYDKDLNLVKEAAVPTDMEGMQKMMAEMKEKCPMCAKMMSGGAAAGDASDSETSEAASSADHAIHH